MCAASSHMCPPQAVLKDAWDGGGCCGLREVTGHSCQALAPWRAPGAAAPLSYLHSPSIMHDPGLPSPTVPCPHLVLDDWVRRCLGCFNS